MPDTFALADGGSISYAKDFLAPEDADKLFDQLQNGISWRQETTVFGNAVPRLTAYFADADVHYHYSGVSHQPVSWTTELNAVRRRVEAEADAPFNSLLLNYYRDGNDSVGWHADDEPELGENPIVPSISLGGVRRFVLKHNTNGEKLHFDLAHGSLLIMGGTLQHFWKHSIPKTAAPVDPRINLTFRNITSRGKPM